MFLNYETTFFPLENKHSICTINICPDFILIAWDSKYVFFPLLSQTALSPTFSMLRFYNNISYFVSFSLFWVGLAFYPARSVKPTISTAPGSMLICFQIKKEHLLQKDFLY